MKVLLRLLAGKLASAQDEGNIKKVVKISRSTV
jgi:hypothetical protein